MESERKQKLTRRKPLSDCTNTSSSSVTPNPTKHNPPSSALKKSPSKCGASATDITTNLDDASNPSSPQPTVRSTPSLITSSPQGTVDRETSEPISIFFSRRRSSNKRKDKGEEVAIPTSSTPILKVSDSSNKCKEVAIPTSGTPILKVSDSSNKRKDKGKEVAIRTSSSTPIFKLSESSNKRNDKGKEVAIPTSNSTPILKLSDSSNKRKDKGKEVAIPPVSSTPILSLSESSNKRKKDKGKEVAIPTSSTPIVKLSDSSDKWKDKRKEVAIPTSSTPILKVSDSSNKRKDKGKEVAIPISSTPILKVSNSRKKNDGVESANLPKAKAFTVPCRKKHRSVSSEQDVFKDPQLQDYIKKQKAYFQMIDEFELSEEEV